MNFKQQNKEKPWVARNKDVVVMCVWVFFFFVFCFFWGGGGALKGEETEFIWAYVPAQKESCNLYGEYMCIDLISFIKCR